MTARSTRRAAETELIDAAICYADTIHWPTTMTASPEAARFIQALGDYNELGLADVGQPAFSNNSTDTSAQAGNSIRHITGALAKQCYDEIAATFHNHGIGLTVDALEQRLQRSHQTVSARVNELRDRGWVVDSGIRRKTRSGRPAIVWTPSELALKERP